MPRRTKKIYGKKPVQKRRFYTKRYGGDYSENIKGLMHDVAGTFSEDIAAKTTELIKDRLNADFGEKVAEKAADKVIASMAQVFQDAAAKISEKNPTEAPLLNENLGQVEEVSPDFSGNDNSMNEPPVVEDENYLNQPMDSMEPTPSPEEPPPTPTPEEPPPTPTPEEPSSTPSSEEPPPTPTPSPEEPPPTPTPEEPPMEPNPESAPEGTAEGPPPPEAVEPAQTGEGNANPESTEAPKQMGGKSRFLRKEKNRMSRNRRNLDRQYQSRYY